MALFFKAKGGNVISLSGKSIASSGTGLTESQQALLDNLSVEGNDLVFKGHKVKITEELSDSNQAIVDMVNNPESGNGDDYVPDSNDEEINNWFSGEGGESSENEFDDLFKEDDESSSDENEFEDLFNNEGEGSSEENEFDDLFNNDDNLDDTSFDDLFNSDSDDSSGSNEFDDMFNS